MSVLPVGRSLRQFFPDLDELLLDPGAYLNAEPVKIGPRRAYGFAALFGAFGAAFLIACVVSGAWHDERLLLGIGALIGASVWLGWSLMLRGHSLLLRPEGVEVHYRDSVVWCPWSLFNADGSPIVPEGDNPTVAVILPVWTEAVPFVELRRHEMAIAHGVQIKTPHFRFTGPDQVILAARYAIAARDLGVLLLQLGSRLGRKLPRGLPPPDAYPASEPALADIVGPDRDGWYTFPLGKLEFPPRCCNCEESTEALLHVPLGTGDIAGRITGTAAPPALAVPVCADCQRRLQGAQQRAGIRGFNLGAVLGVILAVVLAVLRGVHDALVLAFAGLVGAVAGALAGFLVGSATARAMPVQFQHYRPQQGILQVRFRSAHYADQVLAASSKKRAGS